MGKDDPERLAALLRKSGTPPFSVQPNQDSNPQQFHRPGIIDQGYWIDAIDGGCPGGPNRCSAGDQTAKIFFQPHHCRYRIEARRQSVGRPTDIIITFALDRPLFPSTAYLGHGAIVVTHGGAAK